MKGCRPLTEAEVALVQASFGGTYADRDKALFLLGVKSGFRISELLSLRIGDVSQHGRLVDRVTVPRRQMKNTREGRTVRLHPEAKATLATWLLTVRQDPSATVQTFVFRSRKEVNRPISKG
jgi:integrase